MSVYRRQRRLLSSDVDMRRRLRPSVLFGWMQEAAVAHTEQLGMGRARTLDRGLLWVVTLQTAEIRRMPTYDEEVVLRSWPGPTMHVLFPRYFAMETSAGEPILRASALWALVDSGTRRLTFPERYGIELPGVVTGDELPLPSAPRSLPTEKQREFVVPYSYVDMNGHMNNTRYLDLAEDCLPDAAAGRLLRSVSAEYSREVCLGDRLTLRWGQEGERRYFTGETQGRVFRLGLTYADP